MGPEYMMLFFDDGFPGRGAGLRLPVRMGLQFQPALVIFIQRVPKRAWVRGMDQHGNMKLPTFFPDGIQSRRIDRNSLSLVILEFHPQVLIDLQPSRSIADIRLQLLYCTLRPALLPKMRERNIRELDDPVRVVPPDTTSVDLGSYSSKSIFCALAGISARQARRIARNMVRRMIGNIDCLI